MKPVPILNLRSQNILLDADLAHLYGVPTKRLNEQVKRNSERFSKDFLFRLNAKEKAEVVAKCDHLQKLRFSKKRTSPNFIRDLRSGFHDLAETLHEQT